MRKFSHANKNAALSPTVMLYRATHAMKASKTSKKNLLVSTMWFSSQCDRPCSVATQLSLLFSAWLINVNAKPEKQWHYQTVKTAKTFSWWTSSMWWTIECAVNGAMTHSMCRPTNVTTPAPAWLAWDSRGCYVFDALGGHAKTDRQTDKLYWGSKEPPCCSCMPHPR